MTFREHLSITSNQQGLDPEFVRRLLESGLEIDTCNALIAFAKERWPDHYTRDWRKSTANMAQGREKMAALWARYLEHREQEAA
jgi:hypothetical protein